MCVCVRACVCARVCARIIYITATLLHIMMGALYVDNVHAQYTWHINDHGAINHSPHICCDLEVLDAGLQHHTYHMSHIMLGGTTCLTLLV